MIRRPPRSTQAKTLFPYTTLFRSHRGSLSAPPPGASAPPTSLAPVRLALSTLWHESHFRTHSSPPGMLLPSGKLLFSLQDPALAAAPGSSCPESPQPADAAPLLSSSLTVQTPCTGGRPTHFSVSRAGLRPQRAAARGGTHSWHPVFAGLGNVALVVSVA